MTGTPGSGKTAYIVAYLEKIEIENKVNLLKNKEICKHNFDIIIKNNLQNEFTYIINEVGTGSDLRKEVEILPDGYFDIFAQDFDLRPDDYYVRVNNFNKIVNRIFEISGDFGLKYFLPVRTVYSNIEALKIDNVRPLAYDWRQCPNGSIICIDEIQLVKPFDDEKLRGNPIIEHLSTHRHRGFDFYIITQQPLKVHATIRGLIHLHWHATKPFGWYTKIYQYGQYEQNPNAVRVRISAEKTFKFTPPQYIFKLYKSTDINTAQKRIPVVPLLLIGGLVLFGLYLAISNFIGLFSSVKDKDKQAVIASAPASTPMPVASAPVNNDNSFLNFGNNLVSSPIAMSYNAASTPVDYAYLQAQKDFEYQQKLLQTPVNVIAFGDVCTAYNKDGLPIDMSIVECKKYSSGVKRTLQINSNNPNIKQNQDTTVNSAMPIASVVAS